MTMSHEVDYTVLVHDEGPEGLWAEVEELPGCFVSGATMEELWEALSEAIGLYLSTPDSHVEVNVHSADKARKGRRRDIVDEHRISVCV
jgi:predicted RNase H-like HicB family nuclease